MIVAGTLNLTMTRGCTFESFTITCQDSLGNTVNITGLIPFGEVRVQPGDPLIIDLLPRITDAANGVVTIPEIDDETTATYPTGLYDWDFLLEETSTDNMQRILQGKFAIVNKTTQSD